MYSSTLTDMIVRHQMNEKLEEARRARLANAVNRPSFIRTLASKIASQLTSRTNDQLEPETIKPELPGKHARAGAS